MVPATRGGIFPLKQANFTLFLEAFNKRFRGVPEALRGGEFIPSQVIPTFNDCWLSGITDAEGCFTCSFLSNSNAFRIRFLLAPPFRGGGNQFIRS